MKWIDCQSQAADTNCIALCVARKVPESMNAHVKRDEIRVNLSLICDTFLKCEQLVGSSSYLSKLMITKVPIHALDFLE